jgi:hypothetical protein
MSAGGENLKKRTRAGKAKKKAKDDESVEGGDDSSDDQAKRKPRIRIKVKAGASSDNEEGKKSKKKKKGAKRKRGGDPDGDESVKADMDSAPIPRKKRKKNDLQALKKDIENKESDTTVDGSSDDDLTLHEVAARKSKAGVSSDANEDSKSVYMDLNFWKSKRESLDGSFASARRNFTRFDGWKLPPAVPGDKFPEVANRVLDKMAK